MTTLPEVPATGSADGSGSLSTRPTSTGPMSALPTNARPRWNTLQILKAARTGIIAVVALLLIAAIAGTTVHRDAMKTVGKDSAPSIIAAQHIKSALADMDAQAANELLVPVGARSAATEAYEARRVEAAGALISAAENITIGDAERAPIQTIQVGMGTYERLVQKARDLHANGSTEAIAAYREAATEMDRTLLPAADALDHANDDVLERSYKGQSTQSFGMRALISVAGVLAVVALALAQGFLSFKTRRTLNPLLLLATLLTVGLTVYTLTALGEEQDELKVAKEDAFASIRSLWRARASAYQANSEESRYLLDPAKAAEYGQAFAAESNALAQLPPTGTLVQLLTTEANGHRVKGLTGYLADELNNVTFSGEREAAVATLEKFEAYVTIDREMRRLEESKQHKQAVELCLGAAQGQSNWAFAEFDKALGTTLEINQKAFDDSVEKGTSGLVGMEVKAAVAAVAIAVLVFLGLAGRIREYE